MENKFLPNITFDKCEIMNEDEKERRREEKLAEKERRAAEREQKRREEQEENGFVEHHPSDSEEDDGEYYMVHDEADDYESDEEEDERYIWARTGRVFSFSVTDGERTVELFEKEPIPTLRSEDLFPGSKLVLNNIEYSYGLLFLTKKSFVKIIGEVKSFKDSYIARENFLSQCKKNEILLEPDEEAAPCGFGVDDWKSWQDLKKSLKKQEFAANREWVENSKGDEPEDQRGKELFSFQDDLKFWCGLSKKKL
eukprot:UN34234